METREYFTLRGFEDDYWWYANLRRLTLAMLEKYSRATQHSKMLDIGCGTGGNLDSLKRRFQGVELFGIDIQPLAVSMTRQRGHENVFQASANKLPFRDETFDAAVSLDVFCTREVDEIKAFRESYRVLKRDGTLVVNLPAFEFLRGRHDLAVHTKRRWTAGELSEGLAAAGFSVRRLTYWNLFSFPAVFVKRRFGSLLPVSESRRSDLRPLPMWINQALRGVAGFERMALSRFDLPFGTSIFAVAQKTEHRPT